MRILVELIRFLGRLAVGIGIALVFAVLLALIRDDASFVDSFRIACFVVGVVTLFIAIGGHSQTARMGVHDPTYFTSFFPRLIPQLAKPYSGTTLSSTALIFMTAVVLLALGLLLS
jgi:hypothetical protein